MTPPAALLTRLIIEIQTKANEIAEASRSNLPEGGKSDPNLSLDRLIQQAGADAEIAGYCSTEKSRQNRRDALVRSAASSLLALFVMDREKVFVGIDPGGAEGDSTGIVKMKREGGRLVVLEDTNNSPLVSIALAPDPPRIEEGEGGIFGSDPIPGYSKGNG